ncbi:hypothetical protein SAMN02787142_7665 [Burkholderia sp. WP9]|uniref:hypothetical protein n=1 Tax=Burkholderia sp. WP9 TaxID=1500263 RepID=UPI00089AC8F4|nr:hypothetical protein [Burkholderia sp. WP9]SEF11226.1 hypothetical protein SAMN02787142_7665 [Burkholderia sp. WP9]
MNHSIHTLFINSFWIVAAAIAATAVYRKVAPYLWGRRKGEPVLAHVQRVAHQQEQYQLRQRDLNMTRQKAVRVRAINAGVLIGVMCLASYLMRRVGFEVTNNTILSFGGYVVIGLLACSFAKAVPAELFAGLNWHSRIDVRLYCVWLWPLHVIKAIRRKH